MATWITIALSVGGIGALVEYVRRRGRRGGAGLITAAVLHGLAFLVPVPEGPVPTQEEVRVEFEVASLPPPPVPEPAPEPEPEPEPEAQPEPKAQPKQPPPKRRAKAKPKPAAPTEKPQAPPEASPAPLRFDVSQTAAAGDSGVVVATGTPTAPSGPIGSSKGTGNGRGKGTGNGTARSGPATTPPARGPSWSPLSKASLDVLPLPLSVPKIVCPATASDGVTGTVTLKVQVRANGRVRRVRVVKRLGSGCDEVARKALLRAKFKPAKRLGGGSADFEIDYEYVFSAR